MNCIAYQLKISDKRNCTHWQALLHVHSLCFRRNTGERLYLPIILWQRKQTCPLGGRPSCPIKHKVPLELQLGHHRSAEAECGEKSPQNYVVSGNMYHDHERNHICILPFSMLSMLICILPFSWTIVHGFS